MSEFSLMDYAPIGVSLSSPLVSPPASAGDAAIGPRKRDGPKMMPYECGKDP